MLVGALRSLWPSTDSPLLVPAFYWKLLAARGRRPRCSTPAPGAARPAPSGGVRPRRGRCAVPDLPDRALPHLPRGAGADAAVLGGGLNSGAPRPASRRDRTRSDAAGHRRRWSPTSSGGCGRSAPRRPRLNDQPGRFAGRATTPGSVMPATDMDKIVNLCKRRGFVFPSAEIYGGFRSTYDYGPLGVLLLRNVKDAWWRSMVQLRDDVVGLDAAILVAARRSGRPAATSPTSPTRSSTARNCKERLRADHLTSSTTADHCPNCGTHGPSPRPAQFNLMFKTHAGPVEDDGRRRLPAARDGAGHVRQLHQRAADRPARSRRSASPRSASRSATRSRPATSSSAPASSSRWRWSSSCRPPRPTSGTSTGARSGIAVVPRPRHPARTCCACVPTTPTSCRTTRPAPPTSSSCSRGAGTSSRASPTGPTTT